MTVKVFLVDDHQFFLSGLRAELEKDFRIVGSASDVESAVTGITAAAPDVVLLDVHLPGGGGQEILRQLHDKVEARFLALSVSDDPDDVIAVIRGGARGYVTKTISPDELVTAINQVNSGDAVFSPRLAGFVLDAFREPVQTVADAELDLLTDREKDVLRHIARGYPYKQVAKNLDVSVKTVETHMSSVLRKLQLSSRHELAAWASKRHIV